MCVSVCVWKGVYYWCLWLLVRVRMCVCVCVCVSERKGSGWCVCDYNDDICLSPPPPGINDLHYVCLPVCPVSPPFVVPTYIYKPWTAWCYCLFGAWRQKSGAVIVILSTQTRTRAGSEGRGGAGGALGGCNLHRLWFICTRVLIHPCAQSFLFLSMYVYVGKFYLNVLIWFLLIMSWFQNIWYRYI